MPVISFTPQQRLAIETVGRSVIVSAAAGSGKTAALAERCAHLVCDAPPGQQCGIDELLVLTFTDAAAAEMRARIVETLKTRSHAQPHNKRLREQVALAGSAQISTIHSFCLWLLRRWFSELGIDPAATLLDAEEATLLKREVMDALFTGLYEAAAKGQCPPEALGAPRGEAEPAPDKSGEGELSREFVKLVDDYGLGNDQNISALVLRLFAFATSLPDPAGWLNEARELPGTYPDRVVLALVESLRTELHRQIEHCELMLAAWEKGIPAVDFYASQIREYVARLREWETMVAPSGHHAADESDADPALARFESLRQEIASFEFSKKTGPRLGKGTDPGLSAARDIAREQLRAVKERLFRDRLKKRFALFSVDELIAGLKTTATYVSTIVDLVLAFRSSYSARKRRLDVLDFSDLERYGFDVLCLDGDSQKPSPIARSLQRRFAHVLVDEFQDINPIQQAIIRLVSRESDPDLADNLFVVGDLKQSIYRFRLAEPEIFAGRLQEFRHPRARGTPVALQINFRSRPVILEGVNALFRRLMREGMGNVVYDAEAELYPERKEDPGAAREPIDVHLLERSWDPGETEEEGLTERGLPDFRNPARWTPIEREAFLIGSQIRKLVNGKRSASDEPLRYRDVAVLLRATRINAERMGAMLASLGIPAYSDAGGSLFGALEVRDVLTALTVLDNPQQDIPLGAVLRSGIFGQPLSEDDLVCIRCHNRDIPFHEAVRTYTAPDDVGDRLRAILSRIDRYRREVRRRPLAEVLWSLYQREGYLAYAGGLLNGAQRRANLLKLHDRARRFGTFRRQGLHRFLRFAENLEERDQTIASAPAIGESDDVVRIMSIHQAKGLEFPIVFVAGLGTKFNLGDRNGIMIFERKSRIALRVVDTDRMIEYPSAAHLLCADEIERSAREEELRILYVAMTRAREKLILVGSRRNVTKDLEQARSPGGASPPSLLSIATAATPLDWLIPALAGAPEGEVRGLTGAKCDRPTFDVHLHGRDSMATWSVEGVARASAAATLRAVARGEALPSAEPAAPGDPEVESVLSRMDYTYPRLAVASVRSALGASEAKRIYDDALDLDERRDWLGEKTPLTGPPTGPAGLESGVSAHRGMITHRVLQHLDFAAAVDAAGVASELQRLADEGLISPEDREVVDVPSLDWFVSTPLAEAIRNAGGSYRREFRYIATEPPSYFDPPIGDTPGDKVLVRGVVDGILPAADGLEIIDFKTDAISTEGLQERCERYRPQMELYARAMSRIWRRPVCACRLVFLAPRRVVNLYQEVT